MATASSPVSILDSSPAAGTRSSRRKPDGSAGGLVIPIGRGLAAGRQPAEQMPAQPPDTGANDAAGPSNQQQQQQAGEAGGAAAPGEAGPSSQQQQQRRQHAGRGSSAVAAAAGSNGDVIIIESDDDDDDDVVITAVKAGTKRPRPVVLQHAQQRQQQQQQQQQQPQQPRRLTPGQPPMPTWQQPAVPPRPPSPEPAFKCLICLEGIKPDSMATTPCGHMFCFDCITDAVKVTKKCPKCRKGMQVKSIKRLYPN